MRHSSIILAAICCLTFLLMQPIESVGQNFVYEPKNPAFGGSPVNYQWLLNSANSQNKFQQNQGFGMNDDPMANFQENLQRQVLSELTRGIVRDKLGDNFDLSQEQTLNFGEFSIDVVPSGDGVSFRIFDTATGDETSINIPNI